MSAHRDLVEQMRAHRGVDPHAVLAGTQSSNRAMRRAAAKVVLASPEVPNEGNTTNG